MCIRDRHYGIRSDANYKYTKLYEEYESKVKFRRTEYTAVKISVLDKDPKLAADMANDIAELFDSTMNMMQKQVATKAFQIVEKEYFKLRNNVKQMEDSLNRLRRLGINDYESQAEMINQQLAIELAKGNKAGIKALEDKMAILAEYGGYYVSIRDMLEFERKQLSELRAKYEEAKVDATQSLPHKFVVTSAFKAERKTYPVRWLIMLISFSSTFVLLILVLIILERAALIQEPKKKSSKLSISLKNSKQYQKALKQ